MSLPWFPFNAKAFISDTMRLNTEGKGAYLLLLLDYYEKGGPAPDDDDVLSAIAGLTPESWLRHRRIIAPLFQIENGLWRHARCEKEMAEAASKVAARSGAGKAGAAARWQKDAERIGNGIGNRNGKRMRPPLDSASQPHGEGMANAMAEFGPSVTAPSHNAMPDGTKVPSDSKPMANALANALPEQWQPHAERNGERMHIDINNERREGANAPSPAREGLQLIGSLIDPAFQPSAEAVGIALNEGVPSTELAGWLDDWKQRCIDAGTRSTDWHAAWAREYDRRAKERAKARPKPKVSVSRKPKADGRPMPESWQLTPELIAFARKYRQDPHFIADELRNYCANNPTKYSNHDAAFRTFVLRRAKENGQAQPAQRRAPAPGNGGSILDAFDRLDATLAGASRASAQDHEDGQAPVHRLPEE